MDWRAALRTRLKDDATVQAIVGARVHWNSRPQGGALPAIVLQVISDPRPQHMKASQRLRDSLVQISVMATIPATVAALEEAVVSALLPPAEVHGIAFSRAFLESARDAGEQTDIEFINRTLLDVRVWHRAT